VIRLLVLYVHIAYHAIKTTSITAVSIRNRKPVSCPRPWVVRPVTCPVRELSSLRVASWPVYEMSSPWVGLSESCPVTATTPASLPVCELTKAQVGSLRLGISTSCTVTTVCSVIQRVWSNVRMWHIHISAESPIVLKCRLSILSHLSAETSATIRCLC